MKADARPGIAYRSFDAPVPDFLALVHELDEGLRALNGDLQTIYDRYNGLEGIKDIVIAYDGPDPVGCASIKEHDDGAYEVKRVFVRPGYRGRGIARAMMHRLEELAEGRGATSLVLETGRDFDPAVRLYRSLRFEVMENYGHYKGMAESLCMRKVLGAGRGFFTSDGLRLWYEVEGAGRPLLLLNGGPGFSHEYLEPLRALAGSCRLVFFDQRGTGNSDKADPCEYTIEANVRDIEALRRELGLDSFFLLGHSWGGMLAQAYALEHPRRVSGLILADTFSSTEEINSVLAAMRAAVPESTRAIFEKHESLGLYGKGDRYPDEYQEAIDLAYKPTMMEGPPPECLRNMFGKLASDVYRAMWGDESEFRVTGSLASFDARPRLAAIEAPVLVIVGAHDMSTVAMAEGMVRALPNARLEVFEASHHFPFYEEDGKFLAVTRDFLASGGRAEAGR
jgi:proline-specific peptidase